MNTEMHASTDEAREIREKSLAIVSRIVKGNSPEDRIKRRCVMATGDPQFAVLMRFNNDPVKAGINAIKEGRTIFTDIKMAQAGITRLGHKCDVRCAMDAGDRIVEKTGATRTSSGFIALGEELEGTVIVIGNAPSAALAVCRMIDKGIRPGLLVATPVGFVNAAEAKERVRALNVPSITCVGTRGGTPVAVAVVNELVEMAACGKVY